MAWGQPQLAFHKQIVTELLAEDGLVVLAEGLGILPYVVATFVKIYGAPEQKQPVMILNLTVQEENLLYEELSVSLEEDEHDHPLVFTAVHNEVNSQKRTEIYQRGGVISVTSRILLVDLLNKRIVPQDISGILVYHAHRVLETSTEAFILRLFRQGNKVT
jgi:DNA excision repair protein ERCC-4